MTTFHLVFHTHWDREWYQPRAVFGARLVPVIDALVDALEADPEFRSFHLDGQTILLEDYLGVRPDQEARVAALVAAGRIATGPWYVLADELIPSGESLVRNLLLGSAAAERLGRRSNVMYSPDAFGHPAQWPALAREFGMRHGVIWRGLTPGLRDGDLFRWTGVNGAAVLLYQLPRDGYEIGAALPADADALPGIWPGVRELVASRASSGHVALFIGADHHAAHPEPVRLRELLARLEPEHEVRISSLEEFLQAAEDSDVTMAALEGELRGSYGYTWTLQGVHGTRLPVKRRNARVELALERYAEPLAALARRQGGTDRRPILAQAWRTLVQCHFHDSIAGCTHDRVAEDVVGRLRDASDLAREVSRGSLEELAGHDPDLARTAAEPASVLVVWNPAARPAGGVVVADVTFFRRDVLVGPPGARLARTGKGVAPFALALPDGQVLPVQVIEQRRALERRDARHHYPDQDEVDAVRVAFELPPVPGFGLAELVPVAAGPQLDPRSRVEVNPHGLSNGLIDVQIDATGTLTFRDSGTGSIFPGLFTLESEPDLGDTYSFAPEPGSSPRRSRARVTTRALSDGPLVGILEARWKALEASFRLRLELRAGESFVRIVLELDNQGKDRRLRARLPLGMAGIPAVTGAPFGIEERAAVVPTASSPAEAPVLTAPAQRFITLAGDTRGLAVLTPGHAEYELTPDGDILLTILRSVGQLSREDLPTRPGHAGWPVPTPGAQCQGPDRLELALAPTTRRELDRGRVHQLWEDVFLPPASRWLREAAELAVSDVSVALEGEGLVLSAVKPADDGKGMILRCYNPGSSLRRGRWRIRPAPRRAWLVRADESGDARIPLDRGAIPISAAPGAIVTIRVD